MTIKEFNEIVKKYKIPENTTIFFEGNDLENSDYVLYTKKQNGVIITSTNNEQITDTVSYYKCNVYNSKAEDITKDFIE